jgi:hypothetical protein
MVNILNNLNLKPGAQELINGALVRICLNMVKESKNARNKIRWAEVFRLLCLRLNEDCFSHIKNLSKN